MKKITVIGGGTGTFVVLSGLKNYRLDLGVIVSMMDSGGSTGRLRDQLGVLPPGDLRQALLALSDAPLLWRKLFLYRFQNGDLEGHNFGNLFLSALEKVSSNYEEVIKTASYVLKIKGEVIPVTFKSTHLGVEYESGEIVRGEGNVDKNYHEKSRVKRAFLEPNVQANPQAIKRILESDYIITGPGDLYSSIVPILLVDGMKEAVVKSKAKIIYILNLMTKSGQTTNYTASDHLEDIIGYFGKTPDFIIINNGTIPQDILDWYHKENERIVLNDLDSKNYTGKINVADVVDRNTFEKSVGDKFVDPLVRSILRHSPKKLAKVLFTIIK
ncbi:YvcK family protein [Candidatus Roizmanbacteria bacterium]|nr:YvcK family protein [Candidatus Roizmanbacteria bacterium]